MASKHARKHEARPPRLGKEFRLDSNDFGFIWAGVSNVGGYIKKKKKTPNIICVSVINILPFKLSANEKLFVS